MEVVNLFYPIIVSEAHQQALQIEKSVSRRGVGELFSHGSGGTTGRLRGGISSSSSRPVAVGSSSNNSSAPNIFSAPNQQPRTTGGFKCFNRREVGHRQSECKRLGKRVLFTDTDEGNDDDAVIGGEPQFDEDDEVIEDWVESDVGPLLMARPAYDTVAKAVELEKEELVAGVKSSSSMSSEILLQVSNMVKEVPISKLSDDDFSKEECEDLCRRVKGGLIKRPTVVCITWQ
ncbi:hypothetical protein LWI28_025234 [Acer negundo]|uniref:Uncharacterized protein n=1 Tax=Acer negundo TaxID=4023 RepID=A0AAD5J1N2_ACENE|nr:hypothetical protein LWI28_025234 [Acer negundo]